MSKKLEIKTVQSGRFKTLIEALKDILEDVKIDFLPKGEKINDKGEKIITGGMRIAAYNSTNSVAVYLKLEAEKFQVYNCFEKVSIGLYMPNFYKIIKTITNDDTLTLYMDSYNVNILGIKIENHKKNSASDFKFKLLDLDNENVDIPIVESSYEIDIDSSDFHKICRDMTQFGEHMEILSKDKEVIFKCKGDTATVETKYRQSNITDQNIDKLTIVNTSDELVQGKYHLELLNSFTKCTSLSSKVKLYLSNEFPLILEYMVGDLGLIRFILGPIKENNDPSDDYIYEKDDDNLEEAYIEY